MKETKAKGIAMTTVSLTAAGATLKKSYPQVLRLVMTGRLKCQQTPSGAWVVDIKDLDRLMRKISQEDADQGET